MKRSEAPFGAGHVPLAQAARIGTDMILNPEALSLFGGISGTSPILVILAAGKGTRFGRAPKCIQPVHGTPLGRHSIEAFRRLYSVPVIGLVGYRHTEVAAALGADNVYVCSNNPTGGTAFAAFEAFSVPGLLEQNPLLVVTMGDRIVTPSVYRRLIETHGAGSREAALTFLTAVYEPPKNQGKGRVLRHENGRVLRIVEQRDIDALQDSRARQQLGDLTEGNCPLYAIRAAVLFSFLEHLDNSNAQHQYYLTDIIENISRVGGDIRTVTVTVADPEYDLLCSDVTTPMDLALLEGILASKKELLLAGESSLEEAARLLGRDRPHGQVASIIRQLGDILATVDREKLRFRPDQPVALGVSGGRLRIAFMHPDMGRFFGPAWQIPIGASHQAGEEQIVVLMQSAEDRRIHLFPTNPKFRESINFVPADNELMYPGDDISDWNSYEEFGTRLSENLLLSLGYFTEEELRARREKGQPVPPSTLWMSSNMRRPFSLVGNAITSMRTLRQGNLGARVQQYLGRDNFLGLRIVSTGNIPQGGFSSSSAVTVAAKNAINALFNLDIPPDLLVHLACQAEYGTGVRAGSLDQATEQKGRFGQGALISSNPRDNYRILGAYPVPASRFQLIFPYSVERDRAAWQWSWGFYSESPLPGRLTTGEFRKMTGKAAEIAAFLTQLPLETDFFKYLEEDLVSDGLLSLESRIWICSILRQLPLLAKRSELWDRIQSHRPWYLQQLIEVGRLAPSEASQKADAILGSLFSGWRDPLLRRTLPDGPIVEEEGVPLRAMVAYLFAEVAKNFYLIHHPAEWIDCVTGSQRGDRCVEINPEHLPAPAEMTSALPWEKEWSGPQLMDQWLERCGAKPFDFNRQLDDDSLSMQHPPEFHRLAGSNFFRGLALIDLAEAMLKRAFGQEAIAVRVNAAGQGDYFQVHIDSEKASPDEVKQFLKTAFYARFGLAPDPEFVEVHPGGGAVGVRLSRFDQMPAFIQALRRYASSSATAATP